MLVGGRQVGGRAQHLPVTGLRGFGLELPGTQGGSRRSLPVDGAGYGVTARSRFPLWGKRDTKSAAGKGYRGGSISHHVRPPPACGQEPLPVLPALQVPT